MDFRSLSFCDTWAIHSVWSVEMLFLCSNLRIKWPYKNNTFGSVKNHQIKCAWFLLDKYLFDRNYRWIKAKNVKVYRVGKHQKCETWIISKKIFLDRAKCIVALYLLYEWSLPYDKYLPYTREMMPPWAIIMFYCVCCGISMTK